MAHSQRSGFGGTVAGRAAAGLNESRIGGVVADAFAVRASAPGSVARETGSSLHAQHGAGLLVGLDDDVIVTLQGEAPVRGRVVAVPPDALHTAQGWGHGIGFLYDPELAPHVAGFAR